MNPQKGATNILVVVAVLALISTATYFIVSKKSSQPPSVPKKEISRQISQPESQLGDDNISRQETSKAKDLIESLTRSLREELLKIEPTDTPSIVAAIKKYEASFNSYTATINRLNIETVDKNLLKSIRLGEWGNYKLYLTVKQRFTTNSLASQTIATTQKILDGYLKSQSIQALSRIVIKPSKKSTALFPRFASKIDKMIINTVKAAGQRNVIHKKVILDPDDPGKSGRILICWGYESWIDLESGDIRQEQDVTFGNKCQTEIDITEGATGRKLGLNPVDKLAEWIIPPKRGIGDETKKDPYSDFKDQLETGEYILLGTDIFNGQEVYVLKRPGYKLDYEIISLDAVSYLPVRSLSYIEDVIIIEPTPDADDPTISKLIRTGKLINNFGLRYIVGEVIEKESLPSDFFELKIPDGYELKLWVPHG